MGVLRKYMHLHQLMSMHENVEVGLARALAPAPVILPKQINPRAYACVYTHYYHCVRFPLAD